MAVILSRSQSADLLISGLILDLRPANERRCYFVTTSLFGWAQAQNQPCYMAWMQSPQYAPWRKQAPYIYQALVIKYARYDRFSGFFFKTLPHIRSMQLTTEAAAIDIPTKHSQTYGCKDWKWIFGIWFSMVIIQAFLMAIHKEDTYQYRRRWRQYGHSANFVAT